MNIHGPNLFREPDRIQPIDPDRNDDLDREEKRRRRVFYRGRAWAESDEEQLPVQPAPGHVADEDHPPQGMYGKKEVLERAQHFFNHLVTLEEKVAQLLFLTTEANYDSATLTAIDEEIQHHQIGGLLFQSGDYKRESYLIEHYQELSKTPLLIGNDFLHGLSFYFQGEPPFESFKDWNGEKRFSDIGKAVMVQNRSLGVHFQYERERLDDPKITMTESQARAFRKGVRSAQGIVGRGRLTRHSPPETKPTTSSAPFTPRLSPEDAVQETISIRTLHFLDLTTFDPSRLLETFKSGYDAILLSSHIHEAIATLTQAIRSHKISEADLDRRLMRLLLTKALFL